MRRKRGHYCRVKHILAIVNMALKKSRSSVWILHKEKRCVKFKKGVIIVTKLMYRKNVVRNKGNIKDWGEEICHGKRPSEQIQCVEWVD